MVPVKLNNTPFSMLYDTGSSITCVSSDTLHQLPVNTFRHTRHTPKQSTSASGGKMRSEGRVEISLEVEGKQLKHSFHVLPKLHEPFILGIDFIQQHELNLCPRHQKFYWHNSCPIPHNNVISALEDTHLSPGEIKFCKVHVPPQFEKTHLFSQKSE